MIQRWYGHSVSASFLRFFRCSPCCMGCNLSNSSCWRYVACFASSRISSGNLHGQKNWGSRLIPTSYAVFWQPTISRPTYGKSRINWSRSSKAKMKTYSRRKSLFSTPCSKESFSSAVSTQTLMEKISNFSTLKSGITFSLTSRNFQNTTKSLKNIKMTEELRIMIK